MEEILLLLASKPDEAIAQLTQYNKPIADIQNYRDEYSKLKRDNRDTQIAKTQKDKTIAAKGNTPERKIPANRVAIPFAKKIVQVGTAFEVGERVVVSPRDPGALAKEILRLWDINRLDDKIQKLLEVKKSETESAIVFYIEDINPDTMFNKLLGPNREKEIKSVVRTSKEGKMSPYFDAYGDMKAFVWRFAEKIGDKNINRVWIYDESNLYKLSDETGSMAFDKDGKEAHGFSKIPVVYLSQDAPEWYDVSQMIDRYETTFSKLGAANDYAGYPLLKLYGTLVNMPDKDDDGKTLQFPIKENHDGKEIHGDAEFLTMDNAPESVKLELETLDKLIHTLSSTPQLGISDINFGAISGIAIKLLFLDAIIKAKLNEGGNRTTIERILNVMISGTVITTNVGMKAEAESLFFDVTFKSILPTDFKELVEYLAQGVTAGIISKDTAVKMLGLVGEPADELNTIIAEKEAAAALAIPAEGPAPGDKPKPGDKKKPAPAPGAKEKEKK